MQKIAMKPSTCFPHKEISVANLENEFERVRVSLCFPFDVANESFYDYMARVAALDQPRVRTQSDSSIPRDELNADLIECYPSVAPQCPDPEYRTHLVSACTFFARAEEAMKQQNFEEAWFFLSEVKQHLGHAHGYYEVRSQTNIKISRAKSGGEQRAKNTEIKERALYIQLLGALSPEQGWKSKSDAIKKVSSETARILELFNLSVGDVYARFSEALNSDADVKSALEKNMTIRIG